MIVARKGDEEASDSESIVCTVWSLRARLKDGQEVIHKSTELSSLSSKVNSPCRTNRSPASPARQSHPQFNYHSQTPLPPSSLPTEQDVDEPAFSYTISSGQPTRDKHAKLRGSLWVGLQPSTGIIPAPPSPIPSVPMRLVEPPSPTLLVETTLLFVNQCLALAPHRVFRATPNPSYVMATVLNRMTVRH